ncbi:hypothetical protein NJBCHELONAE_26460 [Mycobacteroides chelonae]|nr:hypothetical protein NJBCHELONAE_26460 [Mycobacteroides chelonae]
MPAVLVNGYMSYRYPAGNGMVGDSETVEVLQCPGVHDGCARLLYGPGLSIDNLYPHSVLREQQGGA